MERAERKERMEIIRNWINARKEDNEVTRCIFYITVPKYTDILKDETMKKVEAMLERNNVTCNRIDTVSGAWNLNRDWIETGKMDCIVEFCGVYPIKWNMKDVVEFERMENDGEILVLVDWIQDGKYIPNH